MKINKLQLSILIFALSLRVFAAEPVHGENAENLYNSLLDAPYIVSTGMASTENDVGRIECRKPNASSVWSCQAHELTLAGYPVFQISAGNSALLASTLINLGVPQQAMADSSELKVSRIICRSNGDGSYTAIFFR